MGRHGENIRKRNDGRWEGRYKVFDQGRNRNVYRSVYGHAYEEVREKLSKARLGLTCQAEGKKEWKSRILSKRAGINPVQLYFHRLPGNGLRKLQAGENIRPI